MGYLSHGPRQRLPAPRGMVNLREQVNMNEGIPSPEEPDRTCTRCGETKPATAFHRLGKGSRRKICGKCRAETRPNRRGTFRETPENRRRRALKYSYGITQEQYEMLLEAQGGVCAICKKPPRGNRRMGVDHCHESGRVRALLCYGCNRWLGVYEKFRNGVAEYDGFLAKYGNGNPLLGYDAS